MGKTESLHTNQALGNSGVLGAPPDYADERARSQSLEAALRVSLDPRSVPVQDTAAVVLADAAKFLAFLKGEK